MVYRYICLVLIPSPALLQKNKQASDWVDAEENMPPIGTLRRKHLDLSVDELTRCVFRGLRLGGKSSYLYKREACTFFPSGWCFLPYDHALDFDINLRENSIN